MLQAYMDDSGSHADSHNCVIAGFWGGVRRWIEFERQWNAILAKYKIEEFHARKFWRRTPDGFGTGEYSGWGKPKLDSFLDELLKVIERTTIYPFAVGVLMSEWNKFSTHDKKLLCGGTLKNISNAPTRAIFLPFRYAAVRAASHCKAGITMHFVFDDDRKSNSWALTCYGAIKEQLSKEQLSNAEAFGELTFADSKKALPLQAADLLAYEARRWCQESNGDPKAPMRESYKRVARRIKTRQDFWLFDKPRFAGMMRDVVREKEKRDKQN